MSVIEKAVAILRKDNSTLQRDNLTGLGANQGHKVNATNEGIICELNHEALQEQGYLNAGSNQAQFSEEYRRIKRPLLANAFGKGITPVKNGNLIMVTSSIAGEGKTFTAINLALSIALERDTTVLLIDADVVKPKMTNLFGMSEQPGLIDVLDNSSMTLSDVIIPTNNPKLKILPAGDLHEHSTEILSSDRMRSITSELSERYKDRVIIFDTPPLLMSSQAKVLSEYMGQVMLVVEAGSTNKNAISDTISQLGDEKVVGLILNKCKISKINGLGGYYGNYGD